MRRYDKNSSQHLPFRKVISRRSDNRLGTVEVLSCGHSLIGGYLAGTANRRRCHVCRTVKGQPKKVSRCSHCKQVKPIENFQVDKTKFDGVYSRCRDCVKEYHRTPEYRRKRNESGVYRRSRLKFPNKNKARGVYQGALKSGKLVRPTSCQNCGKVPPPTHTGAPGIQGHHPDYNKPLDVIWLCTMCHADAHRKERENA